MKTCEQTKGMSVYQHGESVQRYTMDLYNYFNSSWNCPYDLMYDWILPDWINDNYEYISTHLANRNTIENYTLYHDIGKPYCLTVDSDGKRHFPDHAEVSYNIYMSLFNNKTVGNLIRNDMKIHTIKACDIDDFMKIDNYITLLIVGLAEIHSNAAMFGGTDSISFKMKWKQINQRGKAIFNKLKK